MDKSTQEKIEANCSAEFIESLAILGEHNLSAAIQLAGYSDGFCEGYTKGYDIGYEDGCL